MQTMTQVEINVQHKASEQKVMQLTRDHMQYVSFARHLCGLSNDSIFLLRKKNHVLSAM